MKRDDKSHAKVRRHIVVRETTSRRRERRRTHLNIGWPGWRIGGWSSESNRTEYVVRWNAQPARCRDTLKAVVVGRHFRFLQLHELLATGFPKVSLAKVGPLTLMHRR